MSHIHASLVLLTAAFAAACSGGDEPIDTSSDPDTEAPEPDTEAVVDCEVSDWSAWSECSAECDGGSRERTRAVTQPANNGAACPDLTQTEACNTQACATPNTVRVVDYEGGAFAKLTSQQWMHNTSNNRTALSEFDADASTVYLSDDVFTNYYLNLDTDAIRTSTAASTSTSAFASITSAEGLVINGFSATRAPYASGEFKMLPSGQWVEHNDDGIHRFNELRRDPWTVYLRRSDDAFTVELDFYLMQVQLQPDDQPEAVLQTLIDPTTYAPDALSVREVLHSSGAFTQTGWTRWEEDATDGAHFFEEVERDASSIWLDDIDRDVIVQLDIASGVVNVGPEGNNRLLYTISETW